MKKTKATYEFSERYYGVGRFEMATVKLHIDYDTKLFSVLPNRGEPEFTFQFMGVNGYKEQLATLKAIQKAIEFAKDEVKK